jgi:hypothetical protein
MVDEQSCDVGDGILPLKSGWSIGPLRFLVFIHAALCETKLHWVMLGGHIRTHPIHLCITAEFEETGLG